MKKQTLKQYCRANGIDRKAAELLTEFAREAQLGEAELVEVCRRMVRVPRLKGKGPITVAEFKMIFCQSVQQHRVQQQYPNAPWQVVESISQIRFMWLTWEHWRRSSRSEAEKHEFVDSAIREVFRDWTDMLQTAPVEGRALAKQLMPILERWENVWDDVATTVTAEEGSGYLQDVLTDYENFFLKLSGCAEYVELAVTREAMQWESVH